MTEIRTNYCVACKEMADRIEELETQNEGYKLALAEQLQIRQELESWKAAEEAHHHMLRAEATENARIIGMSAEREMALRGEVERLTLTVRKLQGHQGALEAEVERLRGLLREAEVKLTDVQGAYATKRYADNLLARIRAALEGKSNE